MKYVIEPMLFALEEDCSEKDFKNFVKRIILWDRWLDENPDDVYILSSTEQWLAGRLAYPVYSVFQRLLDKYGINYVKACDLNKTISRLLTFAKKIDKEEDASMADDAILTDIRLSTDSDTCLSSTNDHGALNDLLWHVYCHCHSCEESPENYLIFAKGLSENVTLDVEYQTIVEGEDDFVEKADSVQIRCHSSLKDFFRNADSPSTILRQQQNKNDLSLALRVSVYQKANLPRVMDAFQNYDFTIQNSFYDDYCSAHYSCNTTIMNRLMEEMSNVLLNTHLNNREDFRTGMGGNNPQLKSPDQQYLAWRWFITRSVKMQYWQKDSEYKFANVKEHDLFVCQWEG